MTTRAAHGVGKDVSQGSLPDDTDCAVGQEDSVGDDTRTNDTSGNGSLLLRTLIIPCLLPPKFCSFAVEVCHVETKFLNAIFILCYH